MSENLNLTLNLNLNLLNQNQNQNQLKEMEQGREQEEGEGEVDDRKEGTGTETWTEIGEVGGEVEVEVEELLVRDENRFVMFPIKYPDIFSMYKKSIDSFWKVDDVDLSKDLADWKKLSTDEQYFLKMILAFFSSSDGIVCENLSLRFSNDIQIAEVRAFYAFQNFMESIHSEMYSLLIETYIEDQKEKMDLLQATSNFPFIREKAVWVRKYISDYDAPFNVRLIAFAITEGIFFSSSFAAIFWIKQKNILPGLCLSNEYISRDESLHVEHAILLYSKLKNRVPDNLFFQILDEAVNIEIDFICNSIPCRLIGMNSESMTKYIKFVADRLAVQLGYQKVYHSTNPFDFMELISVETKTNFFEHRVSEYALADKTKSDSVFEFDTYF
jgi:ribonucleoside-diphosphate reductase subunit M2